MVRDGIPFVIVPLVIGVIPVAFGYWWAAIPFLVIAAFMAYFFRDPRRSIPLEPGVVVAPADGLITLVRAADSGTHESVVSIFLSPFDVHINRAPIEGEIVDITYKKGDFLMATKPESRLRNEQNCLTIQGNELTLKCTQIAGVLARRIVCWKRRGERVKCGERFGMIKFGSRTDLVMPPSVEIIVREGMRVRGGETIIGKIKN
jgi:phosphatidylserine decarboxylase